METIKYDEWDGNRGKYEAVVTAGDYGDGKLCFTQINGIKDGVENTEVIFASSQEIAQQAIDNMNVSTEVKEEWQWLLDNPEVDRVENPYS